MAGLIGAGTVPGRTETAEWVYHKTADGLHPDGAEQAMVWLMNRARANPPAEGVFLTTTSDPDVDSATSYFGVNTTLLKAEFAELAVKPPAVFDRRLYEGSRQHSLYMIQQNRQTHDGQFDRLRATGFSYSNAAVSVYAFSKDAVYAHAGLNIDWGQGPGGMQAGRGHRAAIMSSGAAWYSNVGFALIPENDPATSIGPLVFSGAYCQAAEGAPDHYNRFLTGTVWIDANHNQQYDPGEGLDQVRVQPDRGAWHAVTGIAGGWAIPVTSPDTFLLTFTGSTSGAPFNRIAAVGEVSVQVDTPIIPGQLPFVMTARPGHGNQLILEWTGGRGPYQVQETSHLAGGPWINVGGATTATTRTVPLSGSSKYYRVIGN